MASSEEKNSYSLLPKHCTPPSGLTKFIARNPFESDLTNRLHISMISPTVFSKVPNQSCKTSPEFTWTIDELAEMAPAKIDESPMQQTHLLDGKTEATAQEAITKFFSENKIIPSPFHKKPRILFAGKGTPLKVEKGKKDMCTQTDLSLPLDLPDHINNLLKSFFISKQYEQRASEEDEEEAAANSSISLRRKLFHSSDCIDQKEENLKPPTPDCIIKSGGINFLQHNSLFFSGTPVKTNCSRMMKRNFGSPVIGYCRNSPMDCSPILSPILNMSCEIIKTSSLSPTMLD